MGLLAADGGACRGVEHRGQPTRQLWAGPHGDLLVLVRAKELFGWKYRAWGSNGDDHLPVFGFSAGAEARKFLSKSPDNHGASRRRDRSLTCHLLRVTHALHPTEQRARAGELRLETRGRILKPERAGPARNGGDL